MFENSESPSEPKKFEADILPNTFSYTVGYKRILTNAFVKLQVEPKLKLR